MLTESLKAVANGLRVAIIQPPLSVEVHRRVAAFSGLDD